ncbi:MAG: ATP-binding cassette domain-containing protein, partial [Acidimicrobiales bacterium]|nr:ATP-binding cassette domain-containing protein [Acidimicrobiales bacterium]
VAGILLGVFQQGIYWSYPRSSVVDVGFFVIIMFSLLLQPPKSGRSENRGSSSFVDTRSARPIPKEVANFTQIKLLRKFVPIVLAVLFVVVPAVLGQSVALPFSYMVIYGIMTVSLVLLSGWAGQISLGQSGFAGVGAATVGLMIMNFHTDLFISLVLAGIVGTLFSVAIGIPSLRIPGFFLSVATMAFAVPVDTFLLNATHFPSLNPSPVTPPELFSRFDMSNVSVLYIVASIILFGLIIVVKNLRSSRTGRALIGIRDNEPGAQAYGVSPVALKLIAFAIAGAMTGVAGGLLTILQHGSAFSGFDPQLSFTIFIGVVVGGLGSLSGAVLGAIFLGFTQYYLSGIIALAVQGMVVLAFLTLFPEGFGGIATFVRDVYVRALAKRHGILLIGPVNTTDLLDESEKVIIEKVREGPQPILKADGVYAKYGQVEVLFGVTSEVGTGDVLALLGTNGAGKSTLLRVISGLMKPTHGSIIYGGADISKIPPETRVALGLVAIPGGKGVFTSLTVKENLRMASWLYRQEPEYILKTMDEIGTMFPVLLERLNIQAGQLSGGEQQMLAISMAKLLKPKVLLIDELSLGLAPVIVAKMVDAVSEMKKEGITIVVVEQSVNVATLLAKDAVFLERGQVRFGGPIDDLLRRDDILRSVFLGGVAKVIHEMSTEETSLESETPLGVVSKVKLSELNVNVESDDSSSRFEVHSVSKRFGGLSAVDEVSLSVASGAISGIIGANGAGKTTLFDICSGYCIPDSGSVLLEGLPITHLSPHWRSRHGLGRVFQYAALFSSLTVFETLELSFERFITAKEPIASMVAMPAARSMEKAVREKATELMEMLHLESWKDSFISELSTGTRRVVELGAVLAHRPRVLLLDEPSSGLAQREAESLGPLLLEVKNATGASMVIIEHDVPLIASMADELTCMHAGRVIATGPPELVLSKDEVISSFLGSAKEVIARSDGITLPSLS